MYLHSLLLLTCILDSSGMKNDCYFALLNSLDSMSFIQITEKENDFLNILSF